MCVGEKEIEFPLYINLTYFMTTKSFMKKKGDRQEIREKYIRKVYYAAVF